MKFPKFVSLFGSALVLEDIKEEVATYYRPAGEWWIRARFVEGELTTFGHCIKGLNGYKLIEISESDFKKDNEGCDYD